jgi:hypothetical protein
MRIIFCTILLALVFPRWSRAEELISDILAFDPPEFLSVSAPLPNSTNSETGLRIVRRYAARDNDPRTSQRLLIISLRETTAGTDSAPAVTSLRLEDRGLRAEMQAAVNSTPNVIHVSPVTNAEVGGQAALFASCSIPRPYWQKPEGELFPCEVYWVKVQTNRVVEIKLIADSPEHLQTLKACLPRFKIAKSNPSVAAETPGAAP